MVSMIIMKKNAIHTQFTMRKYLKNLREIIMIKLKLLFPLAPLRKNSCTLDAVKVAAQIAD